ncbi:MAG: hypothetical protein D6730_11565 [Bacteroidetes bacterium]|nr:MAG: hypothetical protein D6730_11565 [Bacteroidota bacterium]
MTICFRKYALLFALALLLAAGCTASKIERHARHFRQHGDYYSLAQVVQLLEPGADTARVKALLGTPIDMGFDYRYLLDSLGPNGCVVGAVFHLNEQGRTDQQWIGEICE